MPLISEQPRVGDVGVGCGLQVVEHNTHATNGHSEERANDCMAELMDCRDEEDEEEQDHDLTDVPRKSLHERLHVFDHEQAYTEGQADRGKATGEDKEGAAFKQRKASEDCKQTVSTCDADTHLTESRPFEDADGSRSGYLLLGFGGEELDGLVAEANELGSFEPADQLFNERLFLVQKRGEVTDMDLSIKQG